MATPPLVGLFVGGRGSRMGGVHKGLLAAPDGGSLIERLLARVWDASADATVVLVGQSAAYGHLNLPALEDSPAGVGPLGGLRALLLHARDTGRAAALALSCDLPYLGAELIGRLLREEPHALALAPREGPLWSPLTARYAAAALPRVEAALAANERSLQQVFARLGELARELPLTPEARRELRDWDCPADMLPSTELKT